MSKSNRHRPSIQSFDSRNLAVETKLQQQVAITEAIQATADGVKGALDLRQTARERAYVDAHESAKTAADNLKSAQLATQTLRDGLKKGEIAQKQAGKIREQLAVLAKQAYLAAEAVSRVTDAVDTLAKGVHARVGKNEPMTSPVRTGVDQAKANAAKALEAILVALQDCIRAFAAASLAEDIAGDPLTLGEELHAMLLPPGAREPAERQQSVTVLMHCDIDLSTMQRVAAALEKPSSEVALLNLLCAVKCITQHRDTICQEALTNVMLENSAAQSDRARAAEKLALLNAALNAADAALV